MKRPSKIKVLGQVVTIKEIVGLKNEDGIPCHGLCEVHERVISIEKGMPNNKYERLVRHETFHMKAGISGIGEMLTGEQEEALAVLAEID